MKKCPFCAEEIQDAAIKCRYCGSVLNALSPDAVLHEEIKRLLGDRKKIAAIKLVRARRPTELGDLRAAKTYVEAVEKSTDPAQVLAAAHAPVGLARRPRTSDGKLLAIGLCISFVVIFVAGGIALVIADFGERDAKAQASAEAHAASDPLTTAPAAVDAQKHFEDAWAALMEENRRETGPIDEKNRRDRVTVTPTTPSLAPSGASAQNTAAAESAREAVDKMVNLGLIKRMDVSTGKFYIYGDLWDGFELDAKQKIVRAISGYRQAEYKGLPQVTLYESRSGKELASYGAFSGVTIK